MPLTVLAAESVAYTDFQPIVTEMTNQVSVSTVVGVVAAGVGVCIGLVFMWWGARKVARMFSRAAFRGKIKF